MNAAAALHHADVVIDDHCIATVTLRNAGSLNILGTPAIADLRRAFEQLAARDDVRAVILSGSGDKAFVAGADIKEMATLEPDTARAFIDGLRGLCEAVRHCPAPVIARIPGWALGGGLELAAACDIRIAADSARFGMPEVKVGIPSIIHAALLPRLIGQARAGWLLLTGEPIDAAQALSWALVDAVVPLERLDDEVQRMARHFAALGPQVLRQQKRLLREWQQTDLDTAIARGVDEFAAAFATGEPAAFMARYREKADHGNDAARACSHSRLVDAPRERVFAAIADPARLARWWGPAGFSSTFEVCEFRPGGSWRFVMHGPDGTDYPNENRFAEIVAPERVVVDHISQTHHFVLTITLAAEGARTRVLWHQLFDTAAHREQVAAFVLPANEQNLDRLEAEVRRGATP